MKLTAPLKRSAIATAAGIAVFFSISWSDEASHYGREGRPVVADRAMPEQTGVLDRRRGDSRISEQAAAGERKLQDLGLRQPIRIPALYGRAGPHLPVPELIRGQRLQH